MLSAHPELRVKVVPVDLSRIVLALRVGLFFLYLGFPGPVFFAPVTAGWVPVRAVRSAEHTSELQSRFDLVCRLPLEKKKNTTHVVTVYSDIGFKTQQHHR